MTLDAGCGEAKIPSRPDLASEGIFAGVAIQGFCADPEAMRGDIGGQQLIMRLHRSGSRHPQQRGCPDYLKLAQERR